MTGQEHGNDQETDQLDGCEVSNRPMSMTTVIATMPARMSITMNATMTIRKNLKELGFDV